MALRFAGQLRPGVAEEPVHGLAALSEVRAESPIPSRHVPGEPDTTPRDEFIVRNEGEEVANLRMSVHLAGRRVDGYRLGVAPGGERTVRVNDLIFPEAVPLDVPYRIDIESDVPVGVRFIHVR